MGRGQFFHGKGENIYSLIEFYPLSEHGRSLDNTGDDFFPLMLIILTKSESALHNCSTLYDFLHLFSIKLYLTRISTIIRSITVQ